jgi:predicted transcriptional regulator
MATSQKRGHAVKVLITETTRDRLWALSEHMGQSPATLASVALSEYVARQTSALGAADKAIQSLTDHLGPELVAQVKATFSNP